ncbi:MAG: GAP family protein [Acidimicrobiales bacterium]
MDQAIGAVLAFAVGVAISPVPIIAVILMLFSQRARVNGPMFLAGWVIGLSVAAAVVYALASAGDIASSDSASTGVSWLRVGAGVALLVLAARKWRSRPGPDDEPDMPRWMSGVDHIAPGRAFGLAVVLSAVNPKNLALIFGASTRVSQVAPSTTDAIVALAVFVLIGSSTVGAAVLYDLFGGERAQSSLDRAKAWLTLHNTAVMAVLFVVFGAVLISEGLTS